MSAVSVLAGYTNREEYVLRSFVSISETQMIKETGHGNQAFTPVFHMNAELSATGEKFLPSENRFQLSVQ